MKFIAKKVQAKFQIKSTALFLLEIYEFGFFSMLDVWC